MNSSPKISIIVPVYNAEQYIKRCMDCIYAQTFTDYEIILVNDGSIDNSASICEEYAKSDDRVVFLSKENGGAGSARNLGISVAKGEYLAFPDVDDFFSPDMYADLYTIVKEKDYDVVFSGENCYTQDGGEIAFSHTVPCKEVSYTEQAKMRENIMDFFPTSLIFDSPCNKLYKRSVVEAYGVRYSDTRRCQDAMFNIDFFNAATSAVSVDKAYYNYIVNTEQSKNRKFPKNYIDIVFAYYDKLIFILSSWGVYEGEIKTHYDTSLVLGVYEAMGMFDNPKWALSKKEQKEYIIGIMNRDDLLKYLPNLSVRDDALEEAKILTDKDYDGFIKSYKRQKFKDKLRSCKLIAKVYRLIKGK